MSISASSGDFDAIVKQGPGKSLFDSGKTASGTNSTWNQGDLICYDTGFKYLRAVTATGDAVTFVGISDNHVKSGKLFSPYDGLTPVDAAQVSPDFVGPKYGVWGRMILKTGDAFTPGGKVFLADGQNCQTVSSTDPGDGNYIGIFMSAAVTSAAAGQLGDVLLGARYPSATGTGLNFG